MRQERGAEAIVSNSCHRCVVRPPLISHSCDYSDTTSCLQCLRRRREGRRLRVRANAPFCNRNAVHYSRTLGTMKRPKSAVGSGGDKKISQEEVQALVDTNEHYVGFYRSRLQVTCDECGVMCDV